MKRYIKAYLTRFLIVVLATCGNCSQTYAATPADLFDLDWELKRDKDGIQVYTGKVEDSKFRAVRAKMTIETTLGALVGLVQDADACPEWADLCERAERVEAISETEMYVYTLNDLPWPVSDRDAIAHVQWQRDRASGAVSMVATVTPDKLPKTKAVRIPYGVTQWIFVPQDNGVVDVISHAHVDPGGATPAWLTNRLLVDSPFTTLQKMRKLVQSDRYVNNSFDFLAEVDTVPLPE